jgi:nucleotide-binding universal stress UspA family protein
MHSLGWEARVRSTLESRQPGAHLRPRVDLRRILCAFDLSAASHRGLAFGVMLARQFGAEARVVHVVRPTAGPSERVRTAAAIERACQRLRDEAAPVSPFPGRPESVEVLLREGDPVRAIVEHAAEWPADLLVMGTHGESPRQSWGLGSTTDAVVRRSAVPVLAVPPPPPGEAAAPPHAFQRVLAAFDFSDPGRQMLEQVAGIIDAAQADVTLLHVLEWFPSEGAGAWESFRVPECQLDLAEVTADRLGRALRASALAGLPYRAEVAAGIPYREILRVAAERQADLIALGLHSRRAIDQWLPGSTISHLLRESRCPVLAVKL